MARLVKITGMEQVIKNLKLSGKKIEGGLGIGLKRAGLFLQRESQKMVPVQTGNLKNTAFTRSFSLGLKKEVIVGYTAEYAAYVHENPHAAHGKVFNAKHAGEIAHFKGMKTGNAQNGMFKRGANQRWKFLEIPARLYRFKMLKMVRDSANYIK